MGVKGGHHRRSLPVLRRCSVVKTAIGTIFALREPGSGLPFAPFTLKRLLLNLILLNSCCLILLTISTDFSLFRNPFIYSFDQEVLLQPCLHETTRQQRAQATADGHSGWVFSRLMGWFDRRADRQFLQIRLEHISNAFSHLFFSCLIRLVD